MINIYIGHYIEVLKTFHALEGVDHVIVEKRKADEGIVDFCADREIELHRVRSSADISALGKAIGPADLCIVASFGLILKNEFLANTNMVVNIHPGSLNHCRGRHPLPLAIKKGLPFMTLTAHLIRDESIDLGPVVAELNLPIDYEAAYSDNDKRLRSCLPYLTEYVLGRWKANDYATMEQAVLPGQASFPYNARLPDNELQEITNAENLKKYQR